MTCQLRIKIHNDIISEGSEEEYVTATRRLEHLSLSLASVVLLPFPRLAGLANILSKAPCSWHIPKMLRERTNSF
ncbi:hypothetical protein E2C01_015599 [Portunus trituberculatus]|uniref:Uncharacterized protein n=1 Tax=Portunus trituberculatus TaxID=210409 RepID=A0A5B7DM04_PORTR|nr:hypothetical protein [Portunus trituberculatus]